MRTATWLPTGYGLSHVDQIAFDSPWGDLEGPCTRSDLGTLEWLPGPYCVLSLGPITTSLSRMLIQTANAGKEQYQNGGRGERDVETQAWCCSTPQVCKHNRPRRPFTEQPASALVPIVTKGGRACGCQAPFYRRRASAKRSRYRPGDAKRGGPGGSAGPGGAAQGAEERHAEVAQQPVHLRGALRHVVLAVRQQRRVVPAEGVVDRRQRLSFPPPPNRKPLPDTGWPPRERWGFSRESQ